RIETGRLLLREFRESDLEAYAAMVSDPEVTRYLADSKPLNRVDAWRQMALCAGHWTLRGFGPWAVEEKASGQFIGRIGCLQREGWAAFEVAYPLARPSWGGGYASEGASASLRFARETLERAEIVSIIRPENHGSIRVATKLGATPAELVDFYGGPARI